MELALHTAFERINDASYKYLDKILFLNLHLSQNILYVKLAND